jgi:hypothetical protein
MPERSTPIFLNNIFSDPMIQNAPWNVWWRLFVDANEGPDDPYYGPWGCWFVENGDGLGHWFWVMKIKASGGHSNQFAMYSDVDIPSFYLWDDWHSIPFKAYRIVFFVYEKDTPNYEGQGIQWGTNAPSCGNWETYIYTGTILSRVQHQSYDMKSIVQGHSTKTYQEGAAIAKKYPKTYLANTRITQKNSSAYQSDSIREGIDYAMYRMKGIVTEKEYVGYNYDTVLTWDVPISYDQDAIVQDIDTVTYRMKGNNLTYLTSGYSMNVNIQKTGFPTIVMPQSFHLVFPGISEAGVPYDSRKE